MSNYLYVRGQPVTLTTKRIMGPDWTAPFIVTRLLPSGGEEPRYEIKGVGETYTRAAFESDLSARSEPFQPW